MIDIKKELIEVQIKHIKKKLEMLRMYFDDYIDLKFIQILCSYEEDIEKETDIYSQLNLYIEMYQKSLDYLYEEIHDNSPIENDYKNNDTPLF